MNRSRGRIARWTRKRAAGDAGFTLIEIIISVSLLGLITGAATASMVTATSAARSTSQSAHESADAQLISAFLVRDAQAAGGSNPVTGAVDASIGVTVDHDAFGNPAPIAPIDAADVCTPANTKVRFTWFDRVSKNLKYPNVASYALNTSTHELVRRACHNGVSSGDMVLGSKVANAVGTCVPATKCPGLPTLVTVTITATNDPVYSTTPFTYDLSAQLRPEGQVKPDKFTAAPSPLFALGGGACPPSGAYINVSGTSSLEVQVGGAIVNSAGGCDSLHVGGAGSYSADSTSLLAGGVCTGTCPSPITYFPQKYDDPLAGLPPLVYPACGAGGNPGLAVGGEYQPGVYNLNLKILSASTFLPGTYIFCNGLDIKASVVAPGVLFYFAGGTLDVNASGSIKISAPPSGDYEGVAIWQPQNLDVRINGIAGLQSYEGIVYAPLSVVFLLGNADLQIGTIIARAINLGGGGHAAFGPGVTIITTGLPDGIVGMPYSLTMEAAGGTPYNAVTHKYQPWQLISGPPGWSMTADGVLSGTPTAVIDYSFVIGVTDSSTPVPISVTRTYPLHVGSGSLAIVTPAMLGAATLTTAYSKTLLASGGSGSYNWGWKPSTTHPGWLSITAGGALSGTPPGPTGTVTVPVRVSLASDPLVFVDRVFSLLVNPLPAIPAQSFAATTVGAASYSATLVATPGTGTAPLTWSIPVGALPPGLSVTGGGVITGVPSALFSTPFTATVTDSNFATATQTFSIVVNAAPSITAPAALPPWDAGIPYPNQSVTTTGGTGTFSWAIATATGLVLTPSADTKSAVISGTPTTSGTLKVTVTVTDSVGVSTFVTYTLTIGPAISISPATLPVWNAQVAYPGTLLSATGGSGSFTYLVTGLPGGLSFNGSHQIVGTPTSAGSFPVSVTVTDIAVLASKTQNFTLVINNALVVTPATLPTWNAGVLYPTTQIAASGGSGTYTFSITGGLPANGLSLNGLRQIVGTPTGPANIPVTVTVTDTVVGVSTTANLTIKINAALTLSPTSLPSWDKDVVYPTTPLTPTGGSGSYSLSLLTPLPLGLNLAGPLGGPYSIQGTPTATTPGGFATQFTLTDTVLGLSTTVTYPITISNAPTINPAAGPLPSWTVGRPSYPSTTTPGYSFAVSGGTGPFTWSIAPVVVGGPSFNASTGLRFNTTTGTISGTAAATPVSLSYTVTVTDAAGLSNSKVYSITLNSAPVLSGTLPNGALGVSYSSGLTLTPATGTGPFTWSASGRPANLLINSSTGVISGTPTVTGTFAITVTVTDVTGATTSLTTNLVIPPVPTALTIKDSNGNTNGKVEKGDKIVVTFSEALRVNSICSSWSGDTNAQTLGVVNGVGVTVTFVAGTGGANDQLTMMSTGCPTFNFGTLNLGSRGYVNGTVTFGGNTNPTTSTVNWNPGAGTLTVVLGTQGGAGSVPNKAVPSSVATFTPSGSMQSIVGVPVPTASTVSTGNIQIF